MSDAIVRGGSSPDGTVLKEPNASTATCRLMTAEDWPEVRAIHAAGIATGNATFESEPKEHWEEFDAGHIAELDIVAVDMGENAGQQQGRAGGRVLGWASASPVSSRPVYRGVAELSIYVHPDARGRGVADLLMSELIARSEAYGIWTLQSSTFPENAASIKLQQRHGFRIVGTRERIAYMRYGPEAGRWRDTVMLERRSATDPVLDPPQ